MLCCNSTCLVKLGSALLWSCMTTSCSSSLTGCSSSCLKPSRETRDWWSGICLGCSSGLSWSSYPPICNCSGGLCAQLAHREAQIEQVRAERDNHFIQEEKVLAHVRLLSSEAKDWKSRVVTEAEEALCRKRAQAAHQATEAQGHGSTL